MQPISRTLHLAKHDTPYIPIKQKPFIPPVPPILPPVSVKLTTLRTVVLPLTGWQ